MFTLTAEQRKELTGGGTEARTRHMLHGDMEQGHCQLLKKKGCKGCYKVLGTTQCLCFKKTDRRGKLRLNQDSEDIDVAVITAYIMEILLIILAWRIIMT